MARLPSWHDTVAIHTSERGKEGSAVLPQRDDRRDAPPPHLSSAGALPVAWSILAANQPHAWRREEGCRWRQRRPAIPQSWTVMVLANRGLDAGWRVRRLVRLGWHPVWRIQAGDPFRPSGQARFGPRRPFTPHAGPRSGPRLSTPAAPIDLYRAGLLGDRLSGALAPWLRPTDWPPDASDACG